MSYFYCIGWAAVLAAGALALAAWIGGSVSVCLLFLVAAAGFAALLVVVSWVYLKINGRA